LVKKLPNIKLIIIGCGYQEKELIEMIEQKGLRGHVRHFKNVPEEELIRLTINNSGNRRYTDVSFFSFLYPLINYSTGLRNID